MKRRTLLAGAAAASVAPAFARRAAAQNAPGVTETEIKIGNIMPYSGPASSYGVIGRFEQVFFRVLNDQGGINGRKINFISLDDGYSPPKTVEVARRLVEQEGVAFIFNSLGTPTNSAIHRYMNQRKVPQLFVSTGAEKWANPKEFPWTIGWQPSYQTEAQIYANWLKKTKPGAKVALLYQNDDFGKDYLNGLKTALGANFDKTVIKTATYETTDATIDSQVVSLQASGADTMITAAIPKFAAQTIRKIHDIGWKPLHIMSNVAISVGLVLEPAGPEKAIGMVSAAYLKDPTDPAWKEDAGMAQWRAFMKAHMPDADTADVSYVFAYGVSLTMKHVLEKCGRDVSRENVMRQTASIGPLELPVLLPGIKVATTPTDFHPIQQMQLTRWTANAWQLFGDVISGTGA